MKAVLDLNEYETGIKVTKTQMEALRIRKHKTHPDWNYTLEPRNQEPLLTSLSILFFRLP